MAPKNTKNAPEHDDVSGLFARLGTQASEGYHDFAYTQLPPRKPEVVPADVPAPAETARPAPEALTPALPIPAPAPRGPIVQAAVAATPAGDPGEVPPADALAPLRKLRQLDEPGPRGLPAPGRLAHTPLERLFQRLSQADVRSSAQSPLRRLRSR
ncbi:MULTISPECIES: hypothetical protein [Xanthomonas]|uniref:Cellulose biosynthesis protein BcsO n=1 Tax=Xanthomonas cucurbitae TaxID=56453 RepID=A0A2S7DVV4_9XANT|nr:hypothetical protein [Xanthomonas cucurbitae]PPU77972.1 hypothetical protein XcuCFBP2542_03885 [Xanthomonas cucurbitae]QHG86056.1 hypothetical protein EBN15_02750 [Xanthomonas cucurbitae]WDM68302.1 hypothetical protein K6981_02965 [Xanthomonas cucurbitae]WDM72175.1 hypothetical protein K6978_02965 [Xanthomonas cucurbitae]WDM75968.1 hypothetical protein K6982_02735 [Xanthomonas cucurbitae]